MRALGPTALVALSAALVAAAWATTATAAPVATADLTSGGDVVAEAGEAFNVTIDVYNRLATSQQIRVVVVGASKDWAWSVGPNATVTVPGASSVDVQLRGRVPIDVDAGANATVRLEGRSNATDVPVTDWIEVDVTVPSDLRFDPTFGVTAEAGTTAAFTFRLTNAGAAANVTLAPGFPADWSGGATTTAIRLANGDRVDVGAFVRVPNGTLPGDYDVRLRAATSYATVEARATLTVVAPPPPKAPDNGTIDPTPPPTEPHPDPAPPPTGPGAEPPAPAPIDDPFAGPSVDVEAPAAPTPAPTPPPEPEPAGPREDGAADGAGALDGEGGAIASDADLPVVPDAGPSAAVVVGVAALAAAGAAAVAGPDLLAGVRRFRALHPGAVGALAAMFTRLEPPRALDHPQRADLVRRIRTTPGVRYRELARETGLAFGVLTYHLRVLERMRVVVARREAGVVRYYEPGVAPRELPRDAATQALLDLVHARGEVRLADAAREIGRDRRDVFRRANELVEKGLVEKVRVGDAVLLRPRSG